MSTETAARPAEDAAPKATEFTAAEHSMLDAMNVPTNRFGRALLFREMQRTGLDPFAKHLYLREDWNKKADRNVYSVASTIAGFEIVAKGQATYEGQTAPQWCDKNGRWYEVWVADGPPVAARIGVYVRGYREPMWGIARFKEYLPDGNGGFMWRKMAAHMIAKVAEALAIRKAYPDQLSGVYTDDEMQQADARKEEQAGTATSEHGKTQRPPGRSNDEWNTVPPDVIAEQQDRDAEASQEPPAEQWDTATGQPLAPPSPGMSSATEQQITEIVKLIGKKRGVYNGQCAGVVSKLVQRPVANPRTLSDAEARSLIETLTAEADHVPLPTEPEPAAAPAGKPTRMATEPQKKMIWGTLNRQQHSKPGGHQLMTRILGREITSTNDLTFEDAKVVIKALNTGEIPGPSEPAPEPLGPNATGEGISEFDVLDQMIRDIDDPQSLMDFNDALTAERGRGTITVSDAELLSERRDEHVKQKQQATKAGASS